jgi:hypothetical protein
MCFESYLSQDCLYLKPLSEEQKKKFIEDWDKQVKNPQAELIVIEQEDNVRNP